MLFNSSESTQKLRKKTMEKNATIRSSMGKQNFHFTWYKQCTDSVSHYEQGLLFFSSDRGKKYRRELFHEKYLVLVSGQCTH
uniref:Uncharacterized protein n=1 Tax=Oryza brachyantha TaxID=4533 RepID=J3KXW5_ORYBR